MSECRDHREGHRRHRDRHHRREVAAEHLIRVGNISVDCTPVEFETPGQAQNIISCAVDQVVLVPVTRTTLVRTPIGGGCFISTPVVQTVQVPVLTTVHVPGVLTPVPQVVCPANVL